MADVMGVTGRTYANYERNERRPDTDALAPLAAEGWNLNWLLTGDGPERLEALQDAASQPSQPVKLDTLTLAVQMAEQALDGDVLDPADYAKLVTLIYDALAHGLPSAQVLALAKPAARGIQGDASGEGKSLGRTGRGTAR